MNIASRQTARYALSNPAPIGLPGSRLGTITGKLYVLLMNVMRAHRQTLRFPYDPTKGLEALVYIAEQWPGIDAFFASKVLFIAEENHINDYGQPIVGDVFKALPYGPVPQAAYDMMSGNDDLSGQSEAIDAALSIERNRRTRLHAKRPADRSRLAPSDLEALDRALAYCRARSFQEISDETHRRRAYREAPQNGQMDYELFVRDDHPHRREMIASLREFAAYGVL